MNKNYDLHKEYIREICELHNANTSGWLQSVAEAIHVANGPKWQENWPVKDIKAIIKEGGCQYAAGRVQSGS